MAVDSLVEKRLEWDESVHIKRVKLRENCVSAFFFPGDKKWGVFKQKYYEFVFKQKYQAIWQKSTFHQKNQPNLAI